jgi:hypothetical protein
MQLSQQLRARHADHYLALTERVALCQETGERL